MSCDYRDKGCDSILRYQSSLLSLHRLYIFYKSNHIPREAFKKVGKGLNRILRYREELNVLILEVSWDSSYQMGQVVIERVDHPKL